MKKDSLYFSLFCLILGLSLLLNEGINFTGAFIGVSVASGLSSLIGFVFLFFGFVLMVSGNTKKEGSLESKVALDKHWKKYPLNKDSIIEDLEREYLGYKKFSGTNTSPQDRIEKMVSGKIMGRNPPNKKTSYEKQFYEGHAAKGGRVIDVKGHIPKKGENKGKLIHFGQPANGRYLWIVDEEGNFIVGNRQTFKHKMPQMNKNKIDYDHRLHKLPHATLAKGKRIYGSGEVLVEGGLIREYNTASGHYIDLDNITGFNEQGKQVFLYFSKKAKWKEVKGGAKFKFKK